MLFFILISSIFSAFSFTLVGTTINIYGDSSLSKNFYQSTGNYKAYTEVILGEGITGLDSESLMSSSQLMRVYLSSTISYISDLAFRYCGKMETLDVASNSTFFKNDQNGLLLSKDGTKLVKAPVIGMSSIDIPTTVKTLVSYCFHNCKVSSIFIPWSVSSITGSLFVDSSITTVTFADNSTLTSISVYFTGWSGVRSIRVPKSVTYLKNAFASSSSLTSITFQEGSELKTIENGVFYGVPISSLELPEGLKTIGSNAIENVASLKYIVIPSTVSSISKDAFDKTTNLETIICKNNPSFISVDDKILYNIDYSIIYVCSVSVNKIEVGPKMEEIGKTLLQGCKELVSLNVSSENPKYSSYEGVLYNKNRTIAYAVIGGIDNVKFVDECEKLDEYCCYSCSLLKNVALSNSINIISKYCFSQSGLTSISLTQSISLIDQHAFSSCSSLRSIDFGKSQLTNISTACFSSTNLEAVCIPASVKSLEDFCFASCESLKSVTFEAGSICSSLNYRSFYKCYSLETVELPPSIVSIMSECFTSDQTLKIDFSNIESLESIDNEAFNYNNMAEVVLCSNFRTVGSYSFANNKNLKLVDLSKTKMIEIGSSAFAECSSLKTLKLPPNLQTLNPLYFVGCTSLTDADASICTNFKNNNGLVYDIDLKTMVFCPPGLKSANLVDGIEALGPNSFYFCSVLLNVEFPDIDCSIIELPLKVFFQCSSLSSIAIPASVEVVCSGAFFSCSLLSKVEFKEGSKLASLDNSTFEGCTSLKEVIFGESLLKTIGSRTFYECRSLVSIKLPSSLLSIGEEVFAECSNLTTIIFTSPSSISTLQPKLFLNCISLADINLPDSLTNLQSGVFDGCTKLSKVSFTGSSLRAIGESVFSGLNIEEVHFDSEIELDSIGNQAFAGTKLLNVSLPLSKSIGSGIFENCQQLHTVNFSAFEKFGQIPARSFYGCSKLEADLRQIAVTSIEDEAFYGCSNIFANTIPYSTVSGKIPFSFNESVSSIGKGSFRKSGIGKQIFLGMNIKSIGESSFIDTSVQNVYYCGTEAVTVTGTLSPFNKGTVAFVSSSYKGNFCGLATLHTIDSDCAMPSMAFTPFGSHDTPIGLFVATLGDCGDLSE